MENEVDTLLNELREALEEAQNAIEKLDRETNALTIGAVTLLIIVLYCLFLIW
jgi:hypothetical protein